MRLLDELYAHDEVGRGEWFVAGLSDDEQMATIAALFVALAQRPDLELDYWTHVQQLQRWDDVELAEHKRQLTNQVLDFVERVGVQAVLEMLGGRERPTQ